MQESPRQPAIKQNLCHSKVQLCHSGLQQKDTCRLQRRGSPGSGPGPPRPCGWSGAEGGIRGRSGRLYECDSRQLTLSREGWPEHPRLTHKKDRRGRQAGPKSPIPLSSPSPRHPWDCPNLPVPSRVAGRTQHSSPTGNQREDSKGVVSTATNHLTEGFRTFASYSQRRRARRAGGRALVTDPNLLWWAEDRQARRGLADAPRWRAAKLLSGSESLSYYYNFLLEVAPSIAQRRVCLALGKARPRAFGGVELFSGTAFGSAWQRRRPRGS